MKRVYIQAGILSIFIFLIGIMIGMWVDGMRISGIRNSLSEADINSYDSRLLNAYFQRLGTEYCGVALEQNLAYNDRIYDEGREIEKKINSNIFTPEIEQEWRRYVLLQTQFWLNSMELKEKCGFDYHTVVHLSRQKESPVSEQIDNKAQSSVLLDLKETCGNRIMLIPITADSDLVVVDSITKQFNISRYPAVVVDESLVLQGTVPLEELRSIVGC